MQIFDIGTIGTSLTANTVSYIAGQWQETLQRALTPGKSSRVRIYNVGAGGVTSQYGLDNIGLLIRYRPRLVTIEYNMNDCRTSNGISVVQSQANNTAIVQAIQAALPGTLIYLMTMNPPIDGAVAARPNIAAYDQMYRSLATSLGVGMIDTAPSWVGATAIDIPDGIHPTLSAQEARVVPAIRTAVVGQFT